ncbi:sigma-54 dependent transcriptional regulator [bacterium]|nr:sigma-54 dependent transcriptional regulator [bacterium]
MKNGQKPTYRGSVLVLDDEENMCKILTKVLNLEGYYVTTFTNPKEALRHLETHSTDVLLTDIRMPEMTGREVLAAVRERGHSCEVIMMTAYGTIQGAIECVKIGALDYITKPFKTDELLVTISRAFEHKRLKEMNSALTEAYNQGARREDVLLLGESPALHRVREMLQKVAPSDSPVLIMGESGTGKELAARSVHRLSRRRGGRFVAINCASIPASLMESELFGYERGAFTGANQTKIGLIELADGGTLFLDEVGELPLPLQAKLLRVLQEHEITRIGGLTNIPVDIRVVSATNRDLQAAITDREFREDLFYRLNVISIELPPLRERREDIPLLAEHFLQEKAAKHNRPDLRFSESVLEALRMLPWKGNVRELENLIERMILLSDTDVITTDLLPEEAGRARRSSSSSTDGVTKLALSAQAMVEEVPDFKSARESFEREYLEALLRGHNGSVTDAARQAGMSRRNLYDKIDKLGIPLTMIKEGTGD